MNDRTQPSRPLAGNTVATNGRPHYTRRLEGREREIWLILKLSHDIAGAGSVADVSGPLLRVVTDDQGLGLRQAVVLLRDPSTSLLYGYDASTPLLADAAREICETLGEKQNVLSPVLCERTCGPLWIGDGTQERTDPLCALFAGEPFLAVPLDAGDECHGALLADCGPLAQPGGASGDVALDSHGARIACLEGLAFTAARAIGTIRVKEGLQHLEEMLNRHAGFCGSLASPRRREDGLRGLIRNALEATGAFWGSIWAQDGTVGRIRMVASLAASSDSSSALLGPAADLAGRVARERRPLRVQREAAIDGPSWLFGLPILALDRVRGVLVLGMSSGARQDDRGRDAPLDHPMLRALVGLAAIMMEHSELSDRVREAGRRVREMERTLLHGERLAALGEVSAKVAHEIRNPLSGIGGFARRIEKGLAPDDPNRSYASIIVREVRRLETLLNEQLLFAQRSEPRLASVDLTVLAKETVRLVADELDEKGVRLLEHYESGGTPMLLDADRVKQVILNILKNAAASTGEGNRVRVVTRFSEGWGQIEIANDGDRMPGEMLDSLFVPFATSRSGGCGLGLAVADQIVKEHGGEVRVCSTEEWSVIFTVSLPVRSNPDRRQHRERRRGGDRRRAA